MTLCRIDFELLGEPIPKQRPRKGKGGRIYTPTETVRYERQIRELAAQSRPPHWPTAAASYFLSIVIYSCDRKPDGDNVFKSVADGLTGALWLDDARVGGFFGPPIVSTRPRLQATVLAFDAEPVVEAVNAEVLVNLAKRVATTPSSIRRGVAINELVEFVRRGIG